MCLLEATQASIQCLCRAGEYLASEGLQQQLLGLSAQHLGSGSVPYSERLQLHPGSLAVQPSVLLPDPTEETHATLNHACRTICLQCTRFAFRLQTKMMPQQLVHCTMLASANWASSQQAAWRFEYLQPSTVLCLFV